MTPPHRSALSAPAWERSRQTSWRRTSALPSPLSARSRALLGQRKSSGRFFRGFAWVSSKYANYQHIALLTKDICLRQRGVRLHEGCNSRDLANPPGHPLSAILDTPACLSKVAEVLKATLHGVTSTRSTCNVPVAALMPLPSGWARNPKRFKTMKSGGSTLTTLSEAFSLSCPHSPYQLWKSDVGTIQTS